MSSRNETIFFLTQREPSFAQSVLWDNSTLEMMLLLPLPNQICGLDSTASAVGLTEQTLKTSLPKNWILLTPCQALPFHLGEQ